jgi:osmotically inducible protein OsmC
MTELEHVLYTGRARTTGGRDGGSRSSDGRLDVKLSIPGTAGSGTNPEQLLAAGWSACYLSAICSEAQRLGIALPAAVTIDAEIDLGTIGGMRTLAARFKVSMPGVAQEAARQILSAAHLACPYSRATRGNIQVDIRLA